MAGARNATFICHDKTNKRGGRPQNEIPLQQISRNKAQSYGISINKLSIPTVQYPSCRAQTHRHQFSYKLRFVVWRFKWHSDMPEVIKEILLIFHASFVASTGECLCFLLQCRGTAFVDVDRFTFDFRRFVNLNKYSMQLCVI